MLGGELGGVFCLVVGEDVAPGRGFRFTGSLAARPGFGREIEEAEEVEEEAESG